METNFKPTNKIDEIITADGIEAFRRSSVIRRSPEETQSVRSNPLIATAEEMKRTPQVQPEICSTPLAKCIARKIIRAEDIPPQNSVITPTTRRIGGSDGAKNNEMETPVGGCCIGKPAGEAKSATVKKKALQLKMMSLGEAIDSLLEYYKGRHNVHHEIKKIGSLIKKRHTEVTMAMEECEKLQTTPKKNTPKTSNVSTNLNECSGITTKPVKRTRTGNSPSTQGTSNPVVNALSPAAKKRCATAAFHKTKPVQAPIKDQNAGWTVVKSKIGKKPRKPMRTRPDAIIIAKSENATYADILRKVKTSDSLKTLGEDVKAIRRTAKQELIIELKGAPYGKTSEYQAAIEDVLKTAAKVTVKTHTVTVQCRDLDEVTTAEELCDALHAQCNIKRPDTTAVRSLRTVYNGTQTAFIVLPAGDAKKVLEVQRVRIGWVSCRVRKVESPKRCFKCWGYDHVAQNCKDQIDRSALCRKCGQEGHKALTCKNPEQCALCKGNHAAGSYKCPLAKKARREAIQ